VSAASSLEQVLDHSPSIIFTKDLAARYLFVNREFARVAGRERDRIIGRTADEVFGRKTGECVARSDRRVLAEGRGIEVEDEFEVGGERRVFHSSLFPLRAPDGSVCGVSGIMRDITERKRTEAALRDSEARYRDMFNATADALVLRDADFRIVDVNPAYLKMTGLPREQVIGRDSVLAFRAPPDVLASIKARHREVLDGKDVHTEVQRIAKGGAVVDLELRCIPLQYQGRPHVLYICRDISERKRAEAALRASEEQYRAIFNAAADGMVLRDADFRIVDVNPAFVAMSGYSREEMLGRDRLITNPAESEAAIRALHQRALAGERVQLETESRPKGGAAFDMELRGVPIHYRGSPHVLYIGRDISVRKRAEAALRASEEQYRSIFNAYQDTMVLRDADFRAVDVNAAWVAVTGFSREEAIGQDRVLGDDPPEFEQLLRAWHHKVLAGETMVLETERLRRNGRREQRELRAVRVLHQGKPHVLYIGRDIGERRRAEQALRASEEQYRSIFNATTDALVLRDAQARVVDVNPAFLEMSGYTREQVVGHDQWIFALPELTGRAQEMHGRVIAGESVHFEIKARRKDGTPMDVEMHAVPIRYRGVPHALGMARDITAKKRAEAERAQLEAQLRQAHKMEAIGHLTGGIAHDFNNILTGILGYARLAAERPAATADAKLGRALEEVELACNRARDLIQQMLVFSRGRRGAARVVALAPLVRQSIRLLRSSLPSTLEIAAELSPDAPAALLDPVQADQVLMNLCINARDAMQGQGTVRIGLSPVTLLDAVCTSCRARVAGNFVQLAVADTGPGIAAEVIDRMFEPFFTTKELGQGTGMGLSIVHGIVHEYGGHIVVDSSPRGAQFRLLFPAVAALADSEEPAPRRARLATPRLSGRVLLVDDEDVVASFMCERLQGWGLDVTALSSAAAARELFARAPQDYDMVVTDYAMPRMNGLELARALRAVRPALPLILYSGYADNIPEAQLHIVGVELLHKPIDESALLAALRRHLPSPA
jgi:PAS domain S-box-containing protein